jgi:hypothetical protein
VDRSCSIGVAALTPRVPFLREAVGERVVGRTDAFGGASIVGVSAR